MHLLVEYVIIVNLAFPFGSNFFLLNQVDQKSFRIFVKYPKLCQIKISEKKWTYKPRKRKRKKPEKSNRLNYQ